MVAGLLVRLAALPLLGTSDFELFKTWTANAARDLGGVYGVGPSSPVPHVLSWQGRSLIIDYPPLAIEEWAAVGLLYKRWNPDFQDTRTFNAVLKVPGLLAELALLATLLTVGARYVGPTAARWSALALWLNPALIVHGAVLGYLDAPAAVPAALSVVAAYAGSGWLAGVLLGLAAATKPQAILVAPVVVAVVARRAGTGARALAGMIVGTGLVALATLSPFILRGSVVNVVRSVALLVSRHEAVSDNAANVWWIFTWLARAASGAAELGWRTALSQQVQMVSISRVVNVGLPSPRLVGTTIVVAFCVWAAWRASRAAALADVLAWAGWSMFVYFLFAAQVHENHLYLAVPLFGLAAALDPRFRRAFWGVSAANALNVVLFYGFGGDFPRPSRTALGFDISLLLVLGNLVLFASTTRALLRPTNAEAPAPALTPASR